MFPDPVFTVNRYLPSWLISTQHGAVCPSAYGEDPMGDRWPKKLSRYAETVPRPAPLCALLTNSCEGRAGENSAPSGPRPCPVNGDPFAASRRPPGSTTKLSICEVPVRVPTRWSPVALKNTSPRPAASGTETVEPGIAVRRPPRCRRKPEYPLPPAPEFAT